MMEVRVFLENSHDLGGALVAKRKQRCMIRHKLGVGKVTRCASKKLPHDTRDRRLLGSFEICGDRAQEYLLWWIKKCLHRAIECKIEFFFSNFLR